MDNFLVFKKMMVARNKALNSEVISKAGGQDYDDQDLEDAE